MNFRVMQKDPEFAAEFRAKKHDSRQKSHYVQEERATKVRRQARRHRLARRRILVARSSCTALSFDGFELRGHPAKVGSGVWEPGLVVQAKRASP